jgi:hypothetical protein
LEQERRFLAVSAQISATSALFVFEIPADASPDSVTEPGRPGIPSVTRPTPQRSWTETEPPGVKWVTSVVREYGMH